MSELLLYSGMAICAVAVVSAVIAVIALRFFKARLNRLLDSEYGIQRR